MLDQSITLAAPDRLWRRPAKAKSIFIISVQLLEIANPAAGELLR
jgi:hypothetical protein